MKRLLGIILSAEQSNDLSERAMLDAAQRRAEEYSSAEWQVCAARSASNSTATSRPAVLPRRSDG